MSKKSKRIIILAVLISVFAGAGFSQNALKSFQWRDHLSYNSALSVAELNNKIYCAVTTVDPGNIPFYKQTGQGLFYFNKNDNSYGRLSKVEGLSDVDPVLVRANPANNSLFIAYSNANIDIIRNDVISNISDILRKPIIGNKKINAVTFVGSFAYLATGFGIVVVNVDNLEIKDTYIIGPNGVNSNIYEVALDNTTIYAATENGVFTAPISSNNLSNYQVWQKVNSLPNGPYNTIVNFRGKIYANFSKFLLNGTQLQDTIYTYNGSSWSAYPYKPHDIYGYHLKKLIADDQKNKLIIIDQATFEVRDDNGNQLTRCWGYNGLSYAGFSEVIADPSETDMYWVADRNFGLIKCKADLTIVLANQFQKYAPNGPHSFLSSRIIVQDDVVFVAPVYLGDYPGNSYLGEGAYVFEEGSWREVRKKTGGLFDMNTIAVDPDDKNHFFVGGYGSGVQEFQNDSAINVYTNANSLLHGATGSVVTDTRVNNVLLDEDKNLWVCLSYTPYLFSIKKADNTWKDLNFAPYIGSSVSRFAYMDKNKQVWSSISGIGLIVYHHDGSFAAPSNANTKKLTTSAGNGGLPNADVNCMVEDKEDDIWMGTNAGIAVFYNPESVFSGSDGWDAQQIFIQQEGKTQILLETEQVTCIAVDGANNKWVGTRNSGLYCFSHDGQKQLYHFTKDDSPLFSDNIVSVAVNGNSGEVFIGTDQGMLSFQNTTTEGTEHFENVYSYPNPVKPGYTGPVLIKGMISGTIVKITDVAGNLVYETKCEGGQASWYAKNFKGDRVATGVYFVMCATPDGGEKTITKILVLN
ncbi:MAG: two-component regulator propeller domain-containing protein [Bacteroidia bacterium]